MPTQLPDPAPTSLEIAVLPDAKRARGGRRPRVRARRGRRDRRDRGVFRVASGRRLDAARALSASDAGSVPPSDPLGPDPLLLGRRALRAAGARKVELSNGAGDAARTARDPGEAGLPDERGGRTGAGGPRVRGSLAARVSTAGRSAVRPRAPRPRAATATPRRSSRARRRSPRARRLVAANFVPKLSEWRLTLTYRAINAARRVVFLVSGAEKARVAAASDSQEAARLAGSAGVRRRVSARDTAVAPRRGRRLETLDSRSGLRSEPSCDLRPGNRAIRGVTRPPRRPCPPWTGR